MNVSLQLYEAPSSSSSWRVRCALNYRGIAYESKNADDEGENDAFVRKVNPAAKIAVLIHGDRVLTESLAIIEYLEEMFPGPSLLPRDPIGRAQSRAIALHIVCGIQPLQNVRVRDKAAEMAGIGSKEQWCNYWMQLGLSELEGMLCKTAGKFCVGDTISIADTCIPSIVERGRRWEVNVTQFPTLTRIDENLQEEPAFAASHPTKQIESLTT